MGKPNPPAEEAEDKYLSPGCEELWTAGGKMKQEVEAYLLLKKPIAEFSSLVEYGANLVTTLELFDCAVFPQSESCYLVASLPEKISDTLLSPELLEEAPSFPSSFYRIQKTGSLVEIAKGDTESSYAFELLCYAFGLLPYDIGEGEVFQKLEEFPFADRNILIVANRPVLSFRVKRITPIGVIVTHRDFSTVYRAGFWPKSLSIYELVEDSERWKVNLKKPVEASLHFVPIEALSIHNRK